VSQQYATLADLYAFGAPSSAFGSLTDAQRDAGLLAASVEADGYLRARGTLPLTSYGSDLKEKVCHIATYSLLCRVGFNPDAGSDRNYLMRKESAITWLRMIAKGEVTPEVTFSTAYATGSQPQVRSKTLRGF
jgi:phage gp36-like protein